MSIEAVERILASERESEEHRTAARQQARELVAAAEREGAARVNAVRDRADAEGKELLRQAEERAAARAEAIRREAEEKAEALRTAAEGRLADAAALIVERVVR